MARQLATHQLARVRPALARQGTRDVRHELEALVGGPRAREGDDEGAAVRGRAHAADATTPWPNQRTRAGARELYSAAGFTPGPAPAPAASLRHTPPPQRGHLCHARAMPRPRREPSPDERQAALPLAKAPGRRAAPTPEAIAKTVTDRDPSPVGQPELARSPCASRCRGPCSSGCARGRSGRRGSSRRSFGRSSKARPSSSPRHTQHRDLRVPSVPLGHQHDLLLMPAPLHPRRHAVGAPAVWRGAC